MLLGGVLVAGSIGYAVLGLSPLDAVYQTVLSVTTVGYREVGTDDPSSAYRLFTIALVLFGVATAFFVFSAAMEGVVEGRIQQVFGRRRMTRDIARMTGHIVVCGGGRVGLELADEVTAAGREVVIVDVSSELALSRDMPVVVGDATSDDVLRRAGIERASVLVAALADDAQNVYVVLSGRALRPELLIVARAHAIDAEPKLVHAGADRVVNPQYIGGRRMATYALQPNVAEFLDVVMNSGDLEWKLEEIAIEEASALAGVTMSAADLRNRTGALVLALRDKEGHFRTNPGPDTVLQSDHVLIAMGTAEQLALLEAEADADP